MSKNNRIAMAALTGLLALAPVYAQGTQSSSGGGSMDSHPGAMSKTTTSTTKTMTSTSKMSSTDTAFVKTAAQGGMTEVELSKLAAQKASNADVKSFAQRMVDDHSKANDQLMQLATQKGVTLSPTLSPTKKGEVNKLAKLSGAAFDRSYVSTMVKDHKKTVADFEKASKNAKDADLKSWAGTTLPTLQDHLKMIQDISSGLNKKKM